MLAVREFRALWAAELLSVCGDQLARVGLAVLVYSRTSSASWTALTYALTFLPALVGGVLLGGLADRFPRRDLMVVVDVLRAVVTALMAIPSLPLPALLALVCLLTLGGAPFTAAEQALLPAILHGDRYIAGLSLRTITNQTAQIAGFLGGGALPVSSTRTSRSGSTPPPSRWVPRSWCSACAAHRPRGAAARRARPVPPC